MKLNASTTGSFTLPGEAGYEQLTLALARRWGADTIRDSDGTQLSDEIVQSGYDIYSTICLVRADNAWAKANPDKLQQAFLMSDPVTAGGSTVVIQPLEGYYKQQLRVNLRDDPKEWWQVFDRTSGREVPKEQWSVDPRSGAVTIRGATRWHAYTVNFLAVRIWEEISMYNHHTNDWGEREHLMPIDPIHPESLEQMRKYLKQWLAEHPHTKVVRFTSMFFNFFWPWGDHPRLKFRINDCGSYEFSVSAEAIRQFEKARGYRPSSEDFVNAGLYWASHTVPSKVYRDWIGFMSRFVIETTAEFVEMVHAAGKKAYVFYNDHWLGLEPNEPAFEACRFDGMIDGIFNAFESRKVSATRGVSVRELRLHPYFFPTGVNGAPSFLPGGNPTLECKTYWLDIRRALLRAKIDRIGFGGYLHLAENHPAFIDYVADLGQEFRQLKALHEQDAPWTAPLKVAFLSAWGNLRAWLCCGHFNRGNYYNEAMETVAGLAVQTQFISFEDVLRDGIPGDVDVLINAGIEGDAWTGGRYWRDPGVVEIVSEFVAGGGGIVGIGEPSAARGFSHTHLQLAGVFGVDRELGYTTARNKMPFDVATSHFITADLTLKPDFGREIDGVYVTDDRTSVLASSGTNVRIATRAFGAGRAVYFSGHRAAPANHRLLHRAIFWAAGAEKTFDAWRCENVNTECGYYPAHQLLAVINLTASPQATTVLAPDGRRLAATVPEHGMTLLEA
jgi:beta-D-galactosyl-(1->4)-L-rhamnose phosphorylase